MLATGSNSTKRQTGTDFGVGVKSEGESAGGREFEGPE